MEKQTSACAIYDCGTCEYLASGACPGCATGNQQLHGSDGGDCCGVYSCVHNHDMESCADCQETACALRRSVQSICPLRGKFENKRWWAGRMSRILEGRGQSKPEGEAISEKVVNRLRWYLTVLDLFTAEGAEVVSSWQIAERVGVHAALIRKDLSRFGEFGTPSSGYRVDVLRAGISEILGLDKPCVMVWIGACAFRHHYDALMALGRYNRRIVAVFDVAESDIGTRIGDYVVLPVSELVERTAGLSIAAATVAVPGPYAQSVARTLAGMGVKGILNLSGEVLVLPDQVRLCSLDMAGELLELSHYCG